MIENDSVVENNKEIDLSNLSNQELMDLYKEIDEHVKYLNNNILTIEEE